MGPVVPLSDQFLRPPFRLFTRVIIPGLASGSGNLSRPAGPIGVNAFGLTWSFFTVPIGFGRTPGLQVVYEQRVLEIGVLHTYIDGSTAYVEHHSFHEEGIPLLFNLAFPTRIDYSIVAGAQVQFYWILLL
jgi:hypothetical protein